MGWQSFWVLWLLGGLVLSVPTAGTARGARTEAPSLLRWRARDNDFVRWELHNLAVGEDGTVRFVASPPECASGVFCGEAISPEVAGLSFEEAIASWNIETPTGSWVDVLLRVRVGETWSEWFTMGIWTASSDGPIQRQSVSGQSDAVARVAVDTLILHDGVNPANALQLKLRLLSNQAGVSPQLRAVGVALSPHPPAAPTLSAGNPALWGSALAVPPCSQMVYPDGGEVWCSPTSVAMVLGYWTEQAGGVAGPCEPRVRAAVAGVYDFVYDGHGNWPFNVAYAATQGLEGYVLRLSGLDEAEPWLRRGVPLVVSYGWGVGELDGAPLPSSNGHLAVLVGFTAQGDPMIHDPAAPSDSQVPRSYRRDQWEALWLEHSGGTVYVIAPPDYFDSFRLHLPMVGR